MKRFLLLCMFAASSQAADPAVEGPKVIAEAFGRLSGALAESIAKNGAAGSLSVCSEKAPQIAKEVAQVHGVTLRRATEKPRNPKNAADELEKSMLNAFAASLAQNDAPKPKVLTESDGRRAFFAPIVLGNPLCLQCHGKLGEDIKPETHEAILKLYPEDKATGFKIGDLRGLWRVTFSAE